MKKLFKVVLSVTALSAVALITECSSAPQSSAPEWTKAPARTVDNGYIVYIGSGEDYAPDRATLKAEGIALQDLANECSFAPKGTRIEDRFNEQIGGQTHAYAKVAVEIQDCDDAKKATDVEAIRNLANQPFADEVKKYQDIVDEEGPEAEGSPVPYAAAPAPAPNYGGGGVVVIHDNFGYFVAAQQVAYYKEVVILSPPAAYPVGAPQTVAIVHNISEPAAQIHQYEAANPTARTTAPAWSAMPNRPPAHSLKPEGLRAMSPKRMAHPQGIHPPNNPRRQQQRYQNPNKSQPNPGRRHRRWQNPN